MGQLSFGETATGVIYGFLKYLSTLQSEFRTNKFIFCWDSKTNKRLKIFPEYKNKRIKKDLTEEEQSFEDAFRHQMKMLRKVYLSTIGFRNVFCQKGYESDDIIASVCKNTFNRGTEIIIISSDKDLFQLITPYISIYNPQSNKILDYQGFRKKYGIRPHEWSMMKALAGCTTDCVPGIKGVGEKTAIKYLKGELKESLKAYQAIKSKKGRYIYSRNLALVQLPFGKNTKIFKPKADEFSEKGWREVVKKLGMKSIKNKMLFRRIR